jgi:hypothetical protein
VVTVQFQGAARVRFLATTMCGGGRAHRHRLHLNHPLKSALASADTLTRVGR